MVWYAGKLWVFGGRNINCLGDMFCFDIETYACLVVCVVVVVGGLAARRSRLLSPVCQESVLSAAFPLLWRDTWSRPTQTLTFPSVAGPSGRRSGAVVTCRRHAGDTEWCVLVVACCCGLLL